MWKSTKFLMSFGKQKPVFFQILHQYSLPSKMTPLYFFSSNIMYFQKHLIKVQIFEKSSKFVKFLMSILYWQDNSFSNFASFFIVMTHNSTGNFKLIHFLLWIIVSHQGLNFEIFECSGKHLSNSSCHCWKHKSVFVQI